MRKLLAAVAALILCVAMAATAAAATRTVKVGDNWFVRSDRDNPAVTVRKGDKVTWRWVGDTLHTVRVVKGPQKFRSGRPKSSGMFTRRMRRRGTYRIVCSVHPSQQKMTLRVR